MRPSPPPSTVTRTFSPTTVPLPHELSHDRDFFDENRLQKFTRRLREEPLIPIGVGVTCWAFFGAARSIRRGNGSKANQFFRYRLYAQSFTLVAMLGSSYYYNADRLKRKEYTNLKKQQQAQEKREAWIRELEAREDEDKQWREKMGKVRDLKREEAEVAVVEERRRREDRSDDGRGVIKAAKQKLKEARDTEIAKEATEQAPSVAAAARQRRMDAEKEQERLRRQQEAAKQEAGYGKERTVWGEAGGGFFGWRRLQNFWNARKGGDSD